MSSFTGFVPFGVAPAPQLPKAEKSLLTSGVTAASTRKRKMRPTVLVTARAYSGLSPEIYARGFRAVVASLRQNSQSPLPGLKSTSYLLNVRARMEAEVGHHFADSVAVRSLLDVLVNRVGLDKIAAQVKKPLDSLKVACYYGCLLTRPPKVTQAKQVEYPVEMDRLVSALGAIPVDWGGKTTCCGASLSITRTDIVLDLSAHILAEARAAGADALVVACPLCHANLDGRQHQMTFTDGAGEMPVLYFTQLMALAFGLGAKAAALSKNMVDPKPLLDAKGIAR